MPAVLAGRLNWFSTYFGPKFVKPFIKPASKMAAAVVKINVGFWKRTWKNKYSYTNIFIMNLNTNVGLHLFFYFINIISKRIFYKRTWKKYTA